jgi:hypothetical protein
MGEGSNKMLDSADTNPTPQKLGKGEVAPHTHCVAQTIPRFKNPPSPFQFSAIHPLFLRPKTPPGAK